jgi:hypothetical protein
MVTGEWSLAIAEMAEDAVNIVTVAVVAVEVVAVEVMAAVVVAVVVVAALVVESKLIVAVVVVRDPLKSSASLSPDGMSLIDINILSIVG